MPLLTSPIDGSPMHQIKRFGIELDVCPTSGGVWLDKGEVEKLIEVIKSEIQHQPQERYVAQERSEPKPHYRKGRDYDDDDDDHYRSGHRRKSRLLDIFDF